MTEKQILVVSYSFSNQTRNLLKRLIAGLEESDVSISRERLFPVEPLRFPIGTVPSTLWMMTRTFFRKRYPVQPVNPEIFKKWDLIILAGPTWSYNPSGVVLSFLDRDGKRLFTGQDVLPLISCRGYWRAHFWGLRSLLRKYGSRTVCSPIVFTHPNSEPWNTVGVFLKLAGKMPERGKGWFRKHYPKYGHSRQQMESAYDLGKRLGEDICSGKPMSEIKYETPVPSDKR